MTRAIQSNIAQLLAVFMVVLLSVVTPAIVLLSVVSLLVVLLVAFAGPTVIIRPTAGRDPASRPADDRDAAVAVLVGNMGWQQRTLSKEEGVIVFPGFSRKVLPIVRDFAHEAICLGIATLWQLFNGFSIGVEDLPKVPVFHLVGLRLFGNSLTKF